jgi:hypothetical protein
VRYLNEKSKKNRGIVGIASILFLILGVVSLIFQSSTTVQVYGQVDLGPFQNIGPPFRSDSIDSDSDGTEMFLAYDAQGEENVYTAKILADTGGKRGGAEQDDPRLTIPGGTDPAIDVTPGGQVYIAAEQQGEIAFVECADDDDNCEPPESVSNPAPQIETSCFDGVDNDGDGDVDSDDSDCFACFDSGEGPDVAAFGGMGARLQFVTAIPDPEQICPFEPGDLCDDGIDNDGDGVTDQEDDPDCSLEGGYTSFFDVNCNDGLDNDGDELTDAADPGCNEAGEAFCSNEIDDDGDGLTDGDDPGCDVEPPVGIEGEGSSTENSCRDRLDNDGDRRIDIADPDCKWASENESTVHGLCSDGLDNDDDGEIDSDDEDCFQPGEGAQGGDVETAGAEDNDTAGVEPTSFNLQPGTTTSPQLTFVSTDGGDAPPASNADIASSNDGSDVYVVWEQEGEIMLVASHDGGETWGEIVTASNTLGASTNPSVATSANGETVHVTWQDTPGNGDIFYTRSTNGGETVETSRNLSNTPGRSDDHQLLTEGSNVYVVWVDYTTGNGDIYFRKSNNNGDGTFSSTINLSRGSGLSFLASRDPDMAAQGTKVSVIWAAYPDRAARGAGEIIFRESLNSGGTFGKHIVVSKTPFADSKEPQIDYTPEDGERYAAWNDRGGPRRVNTATGTYNVLAAESYNGITFSAPVNLSDAPNNLFKTKNTSQLEVIFDVGIWDPSSRRG